MKNVILVFTILLMVSCGSSRSNNTPKGNQNNVSSDAPKSPTTKEKGQTPPSIPKI